MMPIDSKFGVAVLWIGILWWIWAGGWVQARRSGTLDPVEAKAKAVMTGNFSVALLAFWLHWTLAVFLFISGFIMYFWARSFFRDRQS